MTFDNEDSLRRIIKEFLKEFEEIEKFLEKEFQTFLEKEPEGLEKGPEEYFYGFSVTIGPDGRPIIREFGRRPRRRVIENGSKEEINEEQEAPPKIREISEEYPDVDVFEDKDTITVVAEIRGVSKENIDVKVLEDKSTLVIKAPGYYRKIRLSSKVNPLTAKAHYKHGVLEVVLKKEK